MKRLRMSRRAGRAHVSALALVLLGCGATHASEAPPNAGPAPTHSPPAQQPVAAAAPQPPSASAEPSCGGTPMTLHFYDVGQGLAVLVELPDGRRLLVDTGESPARPGCGAPCKAWHQHLMDDLAADVGSSPIDMLWITHQHSDHVGGATDVLGKFKVGAYVDNGTITDANQPKAARKAAQQDGAAIDVVDPLHRTVPLANGGDVRLSAIVPASWPTECKSSTENDCSIALRIDYCKSSVLFTGDAEAQEEPHLDPGGPVTLLQVGHHGSDTSTTQAFLDKVKPSYAVISSGKPDEGTNRTYCHPRSVTVERLTQMVGDPSQSIRSFDGAVACTKAKDKNWKDVPASSHLWATARDGDVVLVTRGDGVFERREAPAKK